MEQRRPADKEAVDGIRHAGGEHGVQERRAFEVHAAVQDLDGEDAGAHGRAEDGRKPGGHAGQHENAAFVFRAFDQRGIERTDGSGDERGRALAACGAARPDRDGGGYQLDGSHARTDESASAMEGCDGGIGAVALSLRREGKDQQPGQEAAKGGDEGDEPKSVRADDLVETAAIGDRSRRMVAGEPVEEEGVRQPQHPREEPCGQGPDHAESGGLH